METNLARVLRRDEEFCAMANVENENPFHRHIYHSGVGDIAVDRGHESGFHADSTRGSCLITG